MSKIEPYSEDELIAKGWQVGVTPIDEPYAQIQTVDVKENGVTTVVPTGGYKGMSKVNVNTNVPAVAPKLQNKTLDVTDNGDFNVSPDDGFDGLRNVGVTVNVPQGGNQTLQEVTDLGNETDRPIRIIEDEDGNFAGFEVGEFIEDGLTKIGTRLSKTELEFQNLVFDETFSAYVGTAASYADWGVWLEASTEEYRESTELEKGYLQTSYIDYTTGENNNCYLDSLRLELYRLRRTDINEYVEEFITASIEKGFEDNKQPVLSANPTRTISDKAAKVMRDKLQVSTEWHGTQSEYDALPVKDVPGVEYSIYED